MENSRDAIYVAPIKVAVGVADPPGGGGGRPVPATSAPTTGPADQNAQHAGYAGQAGRLGVGHSAGVLLALSRRGGSVS